MFFLVTWNPSQEICILTKFGDRSPSRIRDIWICQGHATKWKWHHSTYGWMCHDVFSKKCVFFPSLVTAALKKWRSEHFPKDYVAMTSLASGKGCSLSWTYLNSCIYCPSLVTVALLENIFLLRRMKAFNSRKVVKVRHNFKKNAF